ncbi:Gibberellin 2-beta-dioxygenase 2 [Ancistrocladus abbreviatus]
MVVPCPIPSLRSKKTSSSIEGVPTIDLSLNRSKTRKLIVKACEEYGIFKVVNHGVPMAVIDRLEKEGLEFFAKPAWEKQQTAGPARPFGYGCKNIGCNGDMGELEYLLLHINALLSISETSNSISRRHPASFSCAANDYIRAVADLASELLHLVAEGLWVPDRAIFSRLIRDADSDSLLRLNRYPPHPDGLVPVEKIGFGEHSDPQIFTILRSNDVAGLQICRPDGLWVAVPPDPTAVYVMVGDVLQVMTNGKFYSVRHRVMTNSVKSRLSIMYFAGPPPSALISPLPELISPQNPSLYKSFTWSEYKNAAYTSRLGDCRLNRFKSSDLFQKAPKESVV